MLYPWGTWGKEKGNDLLRLYGKWVTVRRRILHCNPISNHDIVPPPLQSCFLITVYLGKTLISPKGDILSLRNDKSAFVLLWCFNRALALQRGIWLSLTSHMTQSFVTCLTMRFVQLFYHLIHEVSQVWKIMNNPHKILIENHAIWHPHGKSPTLFMLTHTVCLAY